MYNNLNSKVSVNGKPKLIMISAAALLGFIIIIISYYIIKGKRTTSVSQASNNVKAASNNVKASSSVSSNKVDSGRMPLDEKEVFNIKRNIYALEDAEAACKVFDSEVATMDQLIDAHKAGADWCNVGWTKDGIAAFPVQKETWLKTQDNEPGRRNECGMTDGINVARSDSHLLYGVNCYGKKPEPRGIEKIKTKYLSDKEKAMLKKLQEFRQNKKEMYLQPFNEDKWSISS
jgi:hypothetical protein